MKIDFQDGHHGGHLGFPIRTILLFFFYLQVTLILPTKFPAIGPLVQEKRKIDFQDGHHGDHLGFWIRTILALSDLQKMQKMHFQDGHHLRFLIRMILAIFVVQSPQCFLPSLESICLLVQEKKRKIDFEDASNGSGLGFLIRTILTNFDLQVTHMLPTNFQVNWPFGSGEEVKNIFSKWPQSWISNQNNFIYF